MLKHEAFINDGKSQSFQGVDEKKQQSYVRNKIGALKKYANKAGTAVGGGPKGAVAISATEEAEAGSNFARSRSTNFQGGSLGPGMSVKGTPVMSSGGTRQMSQQRAALFDT